MNQELPKTYNPAEYEDEIYKTWLKSKFFAPEAHQPRADNPKDKEAFSIALPPPNATGVLHIGHAVMLAIQDSVIRFQRMLGKKTLWLPGTDHAAIATQSVVEKRLQAQGKTKYDLGRKKFLQEVEDFVKSSQGKIKRQMEKIGVSCDWSRERYTLDDGLSNAVKTAFVKMYQDGLIYRGLRIVNWCPHCESTLSDDEVEYKQTKEKLYWLKYGPFTLATTRPETKLGDTGVAVHPDDKRYKKYVGKKYMIPGVLGEFEITVVADRAVDPKFGSGVIKVTPAHDFTDFEIAQRHNIKIKQVINQQGRMMDNCGKYAGLTTSECREEIVKDMETMGLIKKIEDYDHNLSVCYRCGTAIEPLPSEQWFVNVSSKFKVQSSKLNFPKKEASLKELAIWVVKSGQIKIIPDRFEKIYFHWLENLRDWCISRQLWFGHQIPVWYHKKIKNQKSKIKIDENKIYVGLTPPKGKGWVQDPDTLDTWFSSSLWTFSTLGWPKQTKDLKTFHPTSLMETGYDILFFWVARMILMSNYLLGEVPFRTVYLHGLVRDKSGEKMSKSKPETAIDPLEMIEKYGADAVRLSLLIGTAPGNDLKLSEEKIAGFRNFVNKLWNISRYILMTVEKPLFVEKCPKPQTLADKWILSELNELIKKATGGLENYQFSAVGEQIYDFTWNKLADWYIEQSKVHPVIRPLGIELVAEMPGKSPPGHSTGQESKVTEEILLYILQILLKLWQPFTPYVTEVIWSNFIAPLGASVGKQAGLASARGGSALGGKGSKKDLLMIQPWPKPPGKDDKKTVKDFELIQKIIVAIRNIRAESKVPAAKLVDVVISAGNKSKLIEEQAEIIKFLARVENLKIESKTGKIAAPAGSAKAVIEKIEIYVGLGSIIDFSAEKKRIESEANEVAEYIQGIEAKFKNKNFIEKAPQQIVEAEREKLQTQKDKLKKLEEYLKGLK